MIQKTLWVLLVVVTSFSAAFARETLTVGATPVPHAEILEFLKPISAKEGIDLKVVVFTDYVQPNVQFLNQKLDANFYQHVPYLNDFNAKHVGKGKLVLLAKVHIEPFGAYSSQRRSIKNLPKGSTIVIPNNPANGGAIAFAPPWALET